MKLHFTQEWLRKKLAAEPDEPAGCVECGAIAGACADYPNCPGNPKRPTGPAHFIGRGDLVVSDRAGLRAGKRKGEK